MHVIIIEPWVLICLFFLVGAGGIVVKRGDCAFALLVLAKFDRVQFQERRLWFFTLFSAVRSG